MIAVFDIGGTSIKYGVLKETKTLNFIHKNEVETNAKELGGKGVIDKVCELINHLKKTYDINGIAISSAGVVNSKDGSIIYANENIPNYTGMKIKKLIEEKFQIPCTIENDVNCAALGEYTYGKNTISHSAFVLTIGTGIGGSLINNGIIYHGSSFLAGEIGYMLIDNKPFEHIASTSYLISLVESKTNETNLDGRIIFERYKNNDIICIEAVHSLCNNLAKGISNCVYLLNPEAIILGGGIMKQETILRPVIEKYLKQYLNNTFYDSFQLIFASLGNQAGMAGAYAHYQKGIRL